MMNSTNNIIFLISEFISVWLMTLWNQLNQSTTPPANLKPKDAKYLKHFFSVFSKQQMDWVVVSISNFYQDPYYDKAPIK